MPRKPSAFAVGDNVLCFHGPCLYAAVVSLSGGRYDRYRGATLIGQLLTLITPQTPSTPHPSGPEGGGGRRRRLPLLCALPQLERLVIRLSLQKAPRTFESRTELHVVCAV